MERRHQVGRHQNRLGARIHKSSSRTAARSRSAFPHEQRESRVLRTRPHFFSSPSLRPDFPRVAGAVRQHVFALPALFRVCYFCCGGSEGLTRSCCCCCCYCCCCGRRLVRATSEWKPMRFFFASGQRPHPMPVHGLEDG